MAAMTTIQDQMGETQIDYNALDNTTAGRAIQAGFVGALYAVNDFTESQKAQTGAIIALLAGYVATIGAFNAFDEDPRNDLTASISRDSDKVASPAKTWGLFGGVLAGLGVGTYIHVRFHSWLGRTLRKKGISHPHTSMGVIIALAVFAATEVMAKK